MIEVRKIVDGKEFKRCPRCKQYLCLNSKNFWKNSASIDGFYGYCKKCNIEKRKAYYKKYPEKDFNYNMKRLYGITYEEYKKIEKKQNHRCAICNLTLEEADYKSPKGSTKHFHIDHDHKTGKIRGLLCVRCNQGLGSFRNNPYILIKAINYLETNKSVKNERTNNKN